MAKNKSTAPENAEEIKNEEVATDTIEIDVENIDPVALAQAKMEEYLEKWDTQKEHTEETY